MASSKFPLLVLALSLAAGGSAAQDIPIKSTTTEYDSSVVLSTPTINGQPGGGPGGDELLVNVQIIKDKATGAQQWVLVLQALYESTHWRRYSSVDLAGGVHLPGTRQSAAVISCSHRMCRHAEVLVVPLKQQIVQMARADGLKTRWNGEVLGTFELALPASHFNAVAAAAAAQQ